uniref:Glycine receptor subunit beta-like n=1 Tax=Hirondellea gigas TaxID=1518452 RepID=A0A6A7G781_9CRUS
MVDLRKAIPAVLSISGLLLFCFLPYSVSTTEVSVYQFQEDDQPSDSYLTWLGDLESAFDGVQNLTICCWLRFFSVWEVSRFIQLTDEATQKHSIQIDVDVRRIRVSIGGLRRYHKLRSKLRALTWHHLCVTYASKSTFTYVDGLVQDLHKGELRMPIRGTKLKIGAGDAESNFHGQLTQVNMWNRELSGEEIERLADCASHLQGNIIPWNSDWDTHGRVVQFRESLQFFCKTTIEPKYYLFPHMGLYEGFTLCEGLGGRLPTPENKIILKATYEAVTALAEVYSIDCQGYWVGATDEETEGTWIRLKDNKPVTPYWRPSEPDGGDVQNCARCGMKDDLDIEDIPCDWKQCVLCVVPVLPVWTMLGACQIHDRNRLFAPVQNEPGELMFEGYSYYTIERRNNTWYWIEKEENHHNRTIATLVKGSSIRKSWPIGRHSWLFEKSVCDEEPGEVRTLLLSPCKEKHFTCDDATCIPLFQRCDLKPDCRDGSDEKSCRLVQFPLTYRSDIPPAALGSESPLQVALHITIESADIDTASMMMHVNYNLTMTWSDQRLEFLNLNEDRTLNRVKQEMVEQVWVPVVDFTNTKGNHYTVADHEATMMVNMHSIPTLGDDSHAEEVEVYPGTQNSVSIRRKYSKTFQCQFDLSRYPFDRQGCQMEMTMLSASSRLLQFDEDATAAVFSGNRHLIEYTVGDVSLYFHNDRDFAVFFIEVELVRRAGFILMNVYIPSMCLLVISYLTLYFKPAIFQVRMLGTLTTLLVMATLFTQASNQLPKSSYFKMVDVWLLSSILIIFTIIVVHAIIDRLQDTPKPEIPKNPLSAIIVKPDMSQVKTPMRKPVAPTSPTCSIKSNTPSKSKGSRVPSRLSNSSEDELKQKSVMSSPSHSMHDAQELVTSFSRLGMVEKEGCSASTSANDSNRKRYNNKIKDNFSTGSPAGVHSTEDNKNTVGRTYREKTKMRKKNSFVAMERAEFDDDDDNDFDTSKLRRRIEWRFWKWSCKDVDKCRTMIVMSRIVILFIVGVFNIVYWSIALGPK